MQQWSKHMDKTEYEIVMSRIDEQTNLITYYKHQCDEFSKKIINIEKENKNLIGKNVHLEKEHEQSNRSLQDKINDSEKTIKRKYAGNLMSLNLT